MALEKGQGQKAKWEDLRHKHSSWGCGKKWSERGAAVQRGGREGSKPAAPAAHTGMAQKGQLAKQSEQEAWELKEARNSKGSKPLKQEEPRCASAGQVETKKD